LVYKDVLIAIEDIKIYEGMDDMEQKKLTEDSISNDLKVIFRDEPALVDKI